MLKKISIMGALAVVCVAAGAAFLGYSGDGGGGTVAAEPDVIMPTKASRPGCEADDACYVPSELRVKRGDTVVWLNEDSAFHSVTSGAYDAPTGLFDSGYMDPLESFSWTFGDAGTHGYYCTLHPWMEGRIVVE